MKFVKIALFATLWIFIFLPTFGEEIFEACSSGELQKVKLLIEKNPELLNIADKSLNTPLHYAAGSGKTEIVRYLTIKGADIRARNNYGWTALHSSSYQGSTDISELLIASGSDIEERDAFGWTPLFRAIQGGHRPMIEFLVERGADIDATDRDGQTPLFLSVLKGKTEITEYLLAKGAETDIQKGDGETLLHLAASSGNVEMVALLLKSGEDIQAKKRYGMTPLHLAAAFGKREVAELLLEKGADINATSDVAGTPLFQAEVSNRKEVVRLLLARGANIKGWKFPVLKGDYLGQEKPGLKPTAFAPGILINVYRPHGPLAMSPDGKEIYWPASGPYGWEVKIFFTRQVNGVWTAPAMASFSTDAACGGPFVSHDGKRLFFHSRHPTDPDKKLKENSNDIWVVERTGTRWGIPRLLSAAVNTKSNQAFPSVGRAGDLFYQSDDPDRSMGGWDIYVAKNAGGQYTEPINLGPAVNSAYSDCVPCIAPDGSYIIFHSSRPGGYSEGHELYVSFQTRDGTWTLARNMGPVISREGTISSSPSVSPDGKFLFFTRRQAGVFDYCWVSTQIIDGLRPVSTN